MVWGEEQNVITIKTTSALHKIESSMDFFNNAENRRYIMFFRAFASTPALIGIFRLQAIFFGVCSMTVLVAECFPKPDSVCGKYNFP
jgi:hypothetical protein